MASSEQSFDLGDPRNFYCHQCHSRTRVSAEDFTCASCGSGFIEEVNHEEDDNGGLEGGDDPWGGLMSGIGPNPLFDQIIANTLMSTGGVPGGPRVAMVGRPPPAHQHNHEPSPGGAGAGEHAGVGDMFMGDRFLRSLLTNLTGVNFPDGNAEFHMTFAGAGAGGGGNMMFSNPGDYVFGRGGFDAIVTQLLNQMEGTGPPPMAPETIAKNVPTITVTQRHIDENLQCSVCWDDFKLDEIVRQLNCEHIFHPDCIVPWLELHATCPVCRKPLTEEAKVAQDKADREHPDSSGGGGTDSNPSAQSGARGSGTSGASNSSSSTSDGNSSSRGGGGRAGGTAAESVNPLSDAISMVINQFMGPSQTTSATASSQPSSRNAGNEESSSRRDFQDFEPE